MKPATVALLLALLVVLSGVAGLFESWRVPEAVGAEAPAEAFAAGRALEHLRAIARAPRPLGTAEHARVRDYLVAELRRLGLEPEVQTAVVLRQSGALPRGGTVANVMARLPGRAPGKGVLLVAHYDGVPTGPGAGDNATAVAALLETARALRAGDPLDRDVVFLFSDGEEVGLLGAHAFHERHSWAADVGVVVNFESRGSRGPALMFEPGGGSAALVRELRHARPAAVSFGYEIYRRMPNDTDFSIFKRAGLPGMNFAFIHGATAYHTAQDSIDRLDPRSLQHHGDTALTLARRLTARDLDDPWPAAEAVYFNLPGLFVSYPASWVLPLAILLTAAVVVILGLGLRAGHLRVGRLLAAVAFELVGAMLLGVLFMLASPVLCDWSYNFRLWGETTSSALNLLAMALLSAAAVAATARGLRRKLDTDHLLAAGLVTWLGLTLFLSFAAPGASYLFAWPLLATVPAAARLLGRSAEASWSPLDVALAALAGGVTAMLWVPTLAVIGVALGGGTTLLIAVVTALALWGLLAPHLALWSAGKWGRWTPAAATVLALLLLVGVRLASRYDADNRRPSSVFYELDTDSRTARWLSFDKAPDAWTTHFLTAEPESVDAPAYHPPWPAGPVLASPAPVAALDEAPTVTLTDVRATPDGHELKVRLTSPSSTHRVFLVVRPRSRVRAISIDGQRAVPSENAALPSLAFAAPPAAGLEARLETVGDGPLEFELAAQSYGLPDLPGFALPPRPADTMARFYPWISDLTSVRSLTVLEPAKWE